MTKLAMHHGPCKQTNVFARYNEEMYNKSFKACGNCGCKAAVTSVCARKEVTLGICQNWQPLTGLPYFTHMTAQLTTVGLRVSAAMVCHNNCTQFWPSCTGGMQQVVE